ncbi:hypothetical protein ACTA71_008695 [Dictyostelium dimigraforme]
MVIDNYACVHLICTITNLWQVGCSISCGKLDVQYLEPEHVPKIMAYVTIPFRNCIDCANEVCFITFNNSGTNNIYNKAIYTHLPMDGMKFFLKTSIIGENGTRIIINNQLKGRRGNSNDRSLIIFIFVSQNSTCSTFATRFGLLCEEIEI